MFDTGLEPMTSVVGGRRLDDLAIKCLLFCVLFLCLIIFVLVIYRPLASYNSLQDPHLGGFFGNTKMKNHLKKSGLVRSNFFFFLNLNDEFLVII